MLAQAADRLREAVRSVDVASRIGGDEFAVIMPESAAEDGEQLFRRVHNSMRGTALGPDEQRLRLSGGIAELLHGDTPASLFERADAALYRAKELGKDRADIARAGEVRHGPWTPGATTKPRYAAERDDAIAAPAGRPPVERVETTTLARGPRRVPRKTARSLAEEASCPNWRSCAAAGDDPGAVRRARGRRRESADQDRRATAAPHGQDEPGCAAKRDPLGARLREERERAPLDGRRAC